MFKLSYGSTLVFWQSCSLEILSFKVSHDLTITVSDPGLNYAEMEFTSFDLAL